eukprot:CAMPEP_0196136952 /NCGR_PEP_ID=MMETSP0910-20130528/5085_1 /TAXON_ID=49265 /ORGANISM="Thalassiosira rotula, Strain GSO102" /LENGTH=422 /DNA_ID=CAMNT_0041397321 /DNA_START=85 /DNA_END=1349 /DNA_ORIENTATION=+
MKSNFLSLLIASTCLLPFVIHPQQYGVSAAKSPSDDDDATNNNNKNNNNDDDDDDDAPSFVIGGYLPDYRNYININATALHLTDLMLFSLTPETILQSSSSSSSSSTTTKTEGGGEGCCLSSDHYSKIRMARAYKKEQGEKQKQHSGKIRLLLTVGGAGRSDGFRDIVTGTPRIQTQFLEKLVQFCVEQKLDGIDFDFEGIQSLAEWASYATFLKPAADHLHQRNLLLTVALHPGQYLPPETCRNVDRVHVMTYDMKPSSDDDPRRPHHHASIAAAHVELSKFMRNGCPPRKLVMGIPAYGRRHVDGGVRTFSEAVDEILEENFIKESDDDDDDRIRNLIHDTVQSWKGYQFDSPRDVVAKVGYAVSNGLAGVFLWELGQDKRIGGLEEGGILLEAAATSAENMLVARRGRMPRRNGGNGGG